MPAIEVFTVAVKQTGNSLLRCLHSAAIITRCAWFLGISDGQLRRESLDGFKRGDSVSAPPVPRPHLSSLLNRLESV